jgi:hypothetical protein
MFLLTIMLLSASATAQTPLQRSELPQCPLTLSNSPSFRGIQFGLSKEEAENVLQVKLLNDFVRTGDKQIGLETLRFFRNHVNKYSPQLDSVEIIELRLFNNKIYSFSLSFEKTTTWNDITEYTQAVSEQFKLPPNWKASSTSFAKMNCQGFTVESNIYFLPEVRFTDTTVNREIEARRSEIKTKKSN